MNKIAVIMAAMALCLSVMLTACMSGGNVDSDIGGTVSDNSSAANQGSSGSSGGVLSDVGSSIGGIVSDAGSAVSGVGSDVGNMLD